MQAHPRARPDPEWEAVFRHHLRYRHRRHRPTQYRNFRLLAQSRIQRQCLGGNFRNQLSFSCRSTTDSRSLPAAFSLRGRLPTYRSAKSPSCSAIVVSRYCCLSYNAMHSSTGRLEARIITTVVSAVNIINSPLSLWNLLVSSATAIYET